MLKQLQRQRGNDVAEIAITNRESQITNHTSMALVLVFGPEARVFVEKRQRVE
jgi:hypothetical protein